MNALVLMPVRGGLRYARVVLGAPGADASAHRTCAVGVGDLASLIAAHPDDGSLGLLVIRCRFGGTEFPIPVMVDDHSLARLRRLHVQAPLVVAATLGVIDELRAVFPSTPIALAFETSFFVPLPARETTYALPSDVGQTIRRWGYHGLHHEAATDELAQALGVERRPARMISICLDPRPELCAVRGRQPLLVTSGSTPVEGLPGEYTCGEVDPAIALALAADPDIGPERANLLLTRESGFFGMLSYPATLGEVLTAKRARIARVREHLFYQLTLAAGSSVAALEGVDGVVFCGRYADHGDRVAARLLPQLERALDMAPGAIAWRSFRVPLEHVVAEAGMAALLSSRRNALAS